MTYAPVLTIDLTAVQANYTQITKRIGDDCVSAAMVKADAYGLGAKYVVPALEDAGCDLFFVATLAEGLAVRHYTDKKIAVLNGCTDLDKQDFIDNLLTPVLNTLDQARLWQHSGSCFLHVDTGINRLGLPIEHLNDFFDLAIKPDLVMSHFACADEQGHPMNAKQNDAFSAVIDMFWAAEQNPLFSLANSSGLFRDAEYHYDVVRPGMALYGLNPTPESVNPMKPVISLTAPILQIRDAYQGESVGYGASHIITNDTTLATLPLGYADGFHRMGSNRASVFWKGQACPVVGRVSMDLVVIDIGHVQEGQPPKVGDSLEIIGPHQSVDDLAQAFGTIGYEVLTRFGSRFQKIYIPSR